MMRGDKANVNQGPLTWYFICDSLGDGLALHHHWMIGEIQAFGEQQNLRCVCIGAVQDHTKFIESRTSLLAGRGLFLL